MPAHLYPAHFRALIRRRGEKVRWLKSYRCSCNNPKINQYSRNCPNGCYMGYRYVEQNVPNNHKALVTGAKWQVQPVDIGLVQLGDANVATMPDEIPLNRPDKLVLIERFLCARELVEKGVDKLLNKPVAYVNSISLDDGTEFIKGTHWQLVDDTIVWLTSTPALQETEFYSIEYYFHPSFFFLENNKIAPRPTIVSPTIQLPLRGLLTYAHPSAASKAV